MEEDLFKKTPSFLQQEVVLNTVEEILESLDELALKELFSGYETDINSVFNILLNTTTTSIYGKAIPIEASQVYYLPNFTKDLDRSLKKLVLNYFIVTMLPDFEMSWHHIEWGQIYQMYNYLSLIAARGSGKSFFFAKAVPLWHLHRYNKEDKQKNSKFGIQHSQKGTLITSEYKLATSHMDEIMMEIETNPLLRSELMPDKGEGKWGTEQIITKKGSQLNIRSYGSKMRGLHPGWIIVDDFLTDQALYSVEQREKYKQIFFSVIMNLLEPGGQITLVGTPFHELDLYADIKDKKSWASFEYPAIFPNGDILWESKFPLKVLIEKLETQGTLNFTREVLVRPVSSESSIFRFEHIKRSYEGMQDYVLVDNIISHPQKFDQVVIGTDFAISASASADSTSFTVLGTIGKIIWILYMFSGKGMSYDEQMNKLGQLNSAFLPTKIVIESNGMQKIFYQMGVDMGLPVVSHHTGVDKFSLEMGLPAMSVLYETYRIKTPRGDENSRTKSDLLAQGLMSYTFAGEKIQSTAHTSDEVMSLWQGVLGINYMGGGDFNFSFI